MFALGDSIYRRRERERMKKKNGMRTLHTIYIHNICLFVVNMHFHFSCLKNKIPFYERKESKININITNKRTDYVKNGTTCSVCTEN